jgi:hypothetical protein
MNECTYFHLEKQYWCWVFAPQCRLAFQPAVLEMPAFKKKKKKQLSRRNTVCKIQHQKAILSNNMSISPKDKHAWI